MKVRYDYSNGSIMATGKVIACSTYNKKYTCKESDCKKTGKWTYYYQNGNIERVENYKRIKDCNSNAIPDGKWQYFNENGLLVKETEYKEGILWKADITKYYSNNELAGEIQIRNGALDTIKYFEIDSLNLIRNGGFELYYGLPQLIVKNGKNKIEDNVPFWITPNACTPDYYNKFRRLSNVPDNFIQDFNTNYNYAGIILFHEPTSGKYAEYITGELKTQLKPNKHYCIKIRIRLSQNSGYYIDKFGTLFSEKVPSPNSIETQQEMPQIAFNMVLDNRDEWVSISEVYNAKGNEKYLTLGRFCSLSETNVSKITPINLSEGELNQSAYYLIDKVELLDDTSHCNCNAQKRKEDSISRINFELVSPEDSLTFHSGITFILKNIYFDFDQSVLLSTSFPELEKLFSLLNENNISITIMGHTDNIGTEEYNLKLSLNRAGAVRNWLVEKGINGNRIQIEGFGDKIPIKDNNSSEGRAINRRVEFKVNSLYVGQ